MRRRAATLKALEAGEATATEVMERMEPRWRESIWRQAFQRPPHFELRQLVREGVVLERETPPTAKRGWRPGFRYRLASADAPADPADVLSTDEAIAALHDIVEARAQINQLQWAVGVEDRRHVHVRLVQLRRHVSDMMERVEPGFRPGAEG